MVPGFRYMATMAIAVWLGVAAPWPGRAEPVALVEVARARLTPMVIEIPLTGTVTARDHASLSSRVSGLVSAVHVTAGDRVDKGVLLLSLDPTLEKLGLVEAEADSAEARAILDEARRRWDEARRLGPRKGISESEIRATEAEVKIAQAKLERLYAAERYRKELVARHDVYAPFTGVVARRLAEEDAKRYADKTRRLAEEDERKEKKRLAKEEIIRKDREAALLKKQEAERKRLEKQARLESRLVVEKKKKERKKTRSKSKNDDIAKWKAEIKRTK